MVQYPQINQCGIHQQTGKKKNDTTISIDTEKAFDKTQHSIKKNYQQSGFIWNKHHYNKGHISIILSGEKLKAFPLKLGTRPGCPLSPVLFSIALEVYPKQSDKK